MPGDLNLKKSWHPGLAKNRNKVKAAEATAIQSRQDAELRAKELARSRELEELRALQANGKAAPSRNVAWMYRTEQAVATGEGDFLLGKKSAKKQSKQKKMNTSKVLKANKDDPMASFLSRVKPKPKKP